MQKLKSAALFLAAAFAGVTLHAQTVTVAPTGYITVGPGGAQQFTAAAHGFTGDGSATFIWLVSGKVGGNSTIGTISSTGLYTAPTTVPASGMETITAQLASNTKINGTQYIYLVNAGPQLTSISPNPLTVGTINITVTGSGFEPNVYLIVGGVALTASSVTPTVIKATMYQALPPARPSWPAIPIQSTATPSPCP